MEHKYSLFIKTINLSFDYIILNVSMIASYYLVDPSYQFWLRNKSYLPVVLIFNLIWLLSTNLTGLYEQVLNKDSVRTFKGVIQTYMFFVSIICFTIIFVVGTKSYYTTREYLFFSLAIFGGLLGIWKIIFLSIRYSDRASLIESRKAVIIGGGKRGRDLKKFLDNNPDRGYKILGFFDDAKYANYQDINIKHLGQTSDCLAYAITNQVSEVFCTLPSTEQVIIQQLMMEADKHLIRFKFIPDYYDVGIKPTFISSFGHMPIISIRPEPLENILNRCLKRTFDIVFSFFVIVFLFSWLFPVLAILIKMQSKGPVFFVQERSGRDNQSFNCFKFRSMKVNELSNSKQATKNDDRITPIGRFMRKTSIDELPQFFNVLLGNMSVVGPRPHMIKHTEKYSELIDKFMVRHFLKPGITGWAQVNGFRGETKTTDDMLGRIEADVWYLENWSFLLDLKIVFLTFWNAVNGEENAY